MIQNQQGLQVQPKQVYKIISISDIHFGVIDSNYMLEQLQIQFLNRINLINFDIVCICGDLFDSKFMSSNPIITNTICFIDSLIKICRAKQATLVLLAGTYSHDQQQLNLFYHYLLDPSIDLRIVEKMQFESIKGLRFLCIPELYGVPKEEYEQYLYYSGLYDICILHGTYKGSFQGSEIATLSSNHAPVFSINNFVNCAGAILMGHYHIPGCYDEYAYYNGSTFRFRFGEEQEKGFLITLYNHYTRSHYTELIPVKSHSYITININHIINEDPKKIIEYIKHEKDSKGIDYIRVQFNNANENMNVVRNYFRNNGSVKLQEVDKKEKQIEQIDQQILERNKQYSYIIDPSISDYDKFTMYINQNEGYEFITTEELISLLEEVV